MNQSVNQCALTALTMHSQYQLNTLIAHFKVILKYKQLKETETETL